MLHHHYKIIEKIKSILSQTYFIALIYAHLFKIIQETRGEGTPIILTFFSAFKCDFPNVYYLKYNAGNKE